MRLCIDTGCSAGFDDGMMATAMPYPGIINTELALSKIKYASETLIGLTSPCSSADEPLELELA